MGVFIKLDNENLYNQIMMEKLINSICKNKNENKIKYLQDYKFDKQIFYFEENKKVETKKKSFFKNLISFFF